MSVLKYSKLFLILILFFSAQQTFAEETQFPSIDELVVPNSPAFNILGISPSAINRPATPKAVAMSILKATGESNGDFPKNLSLEIAPYWLYSHPDLTFEKYYSKTGLAESFFETLSISIGTTEIKTQVDSQEVDTTRLGVGIHTNLLAGDVAPGLSEKIHELKQKQLESMESIPMEGDISESLNYPSLQKIALDIQKFNKTRVGWLLELAIAGTWDFPENDSSNSDFTRFGAWLTPSYRSKDLKSLTFLGVARYIHEKINTENSDIYDIGASILWMSEELPLSLSAEYIHRFEDKTDDDRLVGILEYKINDTYSVFASYGKTFDNSFEGDDDLVAILGVNLGWGKGPVVKK